MTALKETECDAIVQQGKVVSSRAGQVRVEIRTSSACSSCHAKGACPVGEEAIKEVDVSCPDASFTAGDPVEVSLRLSSGIRALVWGYLIPFVLMISALIAAMSLGGNELISGLAALLVLIPYYVLLFLLRDRMKKDFQFNIKHT